MSRRLKALSRREFLSRTTQVAAGVAAAGTLASCAGPQAAPTLMKRGPVIGANEKINMALIGIRSRGMVHAEQFARMPNVRIKTICDVDSNLLPSRQKEIADIQGYKPQAVQDFRRVLDDKDIHAIAIASPNHWHALTTVWACQAGKHVYVEKPCAHELWEGRKMVQAARKYKCLVQVGFQNRSINNVRQAMKFLHQGGIGEVYMARGLCFKSRGNIGAYPDGYQSQGDDPVMLWGKPQPLYTKQYMSKVDYDLWQGPAPKRPFNPNRFHYNWHWQWEYGNGDIGNQGPHQFDIARWGLGQKEHPVKIRSFGGYYAFENSQQETPNTQIAVYEYPDGRILQFEVRGLYTNGESKIPSGSQTEKQDDIKIGNLFYGSKGWMSIQGSTWKTYFGRNNEPGPGSQTVEQAAEASNLAGAGGEGHFGNFIAALRSGRQQDLNCDIETGYISTALPLLGNISYRLGRDLTFDGKKEKFVSDKEANNMLKRDYRRPYVVPRII